MTKSVLRQLADDAVRDVAVGGLADQVAAEEQPRGDVRGPRGADEVVRVERALRAARRAGTRTSSGRCSGWPRAGRTARRGRQARRMRQAKLRRRAAMKPASLSQLRHADGGLHVGGLQVVADVASRCTCGRSRRQLAELPVEALAAGVVLARVAPAVAAPVAERLDQRLQHAGVLVQHRAALAHRDVVGRVEADRGRVAEGADVLAVVVAPDASQQSSTSHRSCSSQKAVTAARSNGLPSVWASMTARVRGPSAVLELRRRRRCTCRESTSTNTGTQPFWMIGLTVVGKPAATVMTSSPG